MEALFMQTVAVTFSVLICLAGPIAYKRGHGGRRTPQTAQAAPQQSTAKQLLAVRGEVVKIAPKTKGLIAITVHPARDYSDVTVVARENDIVALASTSSRGSDLLGLITGSEESRENERITAAELQTGDIISVIYNPEGENRALEIYVH
ncbi:MAG TPA: hypothetical protein VI756_12080 [Blastocatellia bacterium]